MANENVNETTENMNDYDASQIQILELVNNHYDPLPPVN